MEVKEVTLPLVALLVHLGVAFYVRDCVLLGGLRFQLLECIPTLEMARGGPMVLSLAWKSRQICSKIVAVSLSPMVFERATIVSIVSIVVSNAGLSGSGNGRPNTGSFSHPVRMSSEMSALRSTTALSLEVASIASRYASSSRHRDCR